FNHRRRAAIPLPDAYPRSSEAMEAQPHGCRVEAAVGSLHQSQGGHVRADEHPPEAPWWIVEAVDKKRARINCIQHLLTVIPYDEVYHLEVVLPPRVHNPEYHRGPIPKSMYVPAVY